MEKSTDSAGQAASGAIPTTSFVICVEPGKLEYKASCLLTTFRENWGQWAHCPIYAYSPRAGIEPSAWMRDFYREFNVTAVIEPLNRKYHNYPLANKPAAMAHAERTLDSDILVFLDSDILCWNEPKELAAMQECDLRMVPDATKTVASAGPGDRFEDMWQALYRLARVQSEPYVLTHQTQERVRGWWGSAVIVCRRSAGLMDQWNRFFESVIDDPLFPAEAGYLREQVTLSVVVAANYRRFRPLPMSYNYHVQNYDRYMELGIPPENAILWHYQLFLDRAFKHYSRELDRQPDTKGKLLIARQFSEKLHTNYRKMFGADEPLHKAIRRRLKLGRRIRKLLGIPKPSDLTMLD